MARPHPGRRLADQVAADELGVLAPALGQGDLELLVPDRVLQHLDPVAHGEEPHEDQGERDEASRNVQDMEAEAWILKPGSRKVPPWCSVFHQSTEKCTSGMSTAMSSAATAQRRARTAGSAGTRRSAR